MVESLQKLRGPAIVVLLLVLVLRLALGLVAFSLHRGGTDYAVALSRLADVVVDPLTVVVLVLLVASVTLWFPTPRARSLALAAMSLVGVGLTVSLVATVLWWSNVTLSAATLADFSRRLLSLPVLLLAVVALTRMLPSRAGPESRAERPAISSAPDGDASPAELETAPDPESEPVWQADQASGAAWLTAGDAAAGARASGWGTPGERGGWQPADRGTQPTTGSESADGPHRPT